MSRKRRLLRGFDVPVDLLAEITGRAESTIRKAQRQGPSRRLAEELRLIRELMEGPVRRRRRREEPVRAKPPAKKPLPRRAEPVKAKPPAKKPLPRRAEPVKAKPPAKKPLPRRAEPVKAKPPVKKPLPRRAEPVKAKPPTKKPLPRRAEPVKAKPPAKKPLPRRVEPVRAKPPAKKPLPRRVEPVKAKPPAKKPLPRRVEPVKAKPPAKKPLPKRYPPFMRRAVAAEELILDKLGRLQEGLAFMSRDLDMTVKSFVNADGTVDGELRLRNLPDEWRTVEGMPDLSATLSEAVRAMGAFPTAPRMGGTFWASFGLRFGPKNHREIEEMARFYKRFRGLLQIGAHYTTAQTLSAILNNSLVVRDLVERVWTKRNLPPVQLLVRIFWTPGSKRPGRFAGEEGGTK